MTERERANAQECDQVLDRQILHATSPDVPRVTELVKDHGPRIDTSPFAPDVQGKKCDFCFFGRLCAHGKCSRCDSTNAECGCFGKPAPASRQSEKVCHIGAPACFALEQACQHITESFQCYGCYVVGSSLERADWRDIDIRMIMSDEEFAKEFPSAGPHWEHNPKWLLLTVSISQWLRSQTGLPIDFQIQPQTHANKRHSGQRNAIGLKIVHKEGEVNDSTE